MEVVIIVQYKMLDAGSPSLSDNEPKSAIYYLDDGVEKVLVSVIVDRRS